MSDETIDVQMDWRAQARAVAMQCLTQLDVQGDDFLQDIPAYIAESVRESDVRTLASDLTHAAWGSRKTSDELIAQTVKHWQLQRIALVDRAVLRLAVSELMNRPDVPVKVVLDQAIELAKRYSTAESPQFINGVLDAIVRSLPERRDAAEGRAEHGHGDASRSDRGAAPDGRTESPRDTAGNPAGDRAKDPAGAE